MLSRDSLKMYCYNNESLSDSFKLCCGSWSYDSAPEDSIRQIDASFGVEMLATTGESIALIGFDIKDDNSIVIAHSPQGAHPEFISRTARNELVRKSDFRNRLLGEVISLARSMNAPYIKGYKCSDHPKVVFGSLTFSQGKKAMDDLYIANGFRLGSDGYFCLDLR